MSRRSKPSPEEPQRSAAAARSRGPWIAAAAAAFVLLSLGSALVADWWSALPPEAQASYVGRDACIRCHQKEAELFHGSHHDLAMDRATPETVLGDFSGVELEHHGITSRMYRDGERFMIHTEGPDGRLDDFEIKYVFGYTPLQNYMVEFDRAPGQPEEEIARLQVLRVSWDTEQRRWFHLDPPDTEGRLEPEDPLHWTGITQRWNTSCADCHSTNLQKNFDPDTLTYRTTFSEIDVSCEACHGPGSLHVQLAEARSFFWDRRHGYGLARLKGKDSRPQIETCAGCHSRRRVLQVHPWAGGKYYDHFSNELLRPQTYFADGQVQDEVYVYGSFIQSKMYHQGVRCSDCHDPHSARLIHSGNQVCTSCHQHDPAKYDTPNHHHHAPGTRGSLCVDCHMPETTYMAVDPRRDHSLRVPRPDWSIEFGVPNACTGCHVRPENISSEKARRLTQYLDWVREARVDDEIRAEVERADRWSLEHFRQWYGEPKDDPRRFVHALHAAWNRDPEATRRLTEVITSRQVPGMGRASALIELGLLGGPGELGPAVKSLEDDDPQVRAAAVAALASLPPEELRAHLLPRLEDPARAVRIEAARVLAQVPADLLNGPQRRRRAEVLEEWRAALLTASDRGGTHLALGGLHETLGDAEAAIAAYRTAIRVEPHMVGGRTNLAALLEQRAAREQQLARQAAQQRDRESLERHVMRQVDLEEEARELRRAELPLLAREAEQAPALLARDPRLTEEVAGIYYNYGRALYLNDQTKEAEEALLEAARLAPRAESILLLLTLFYQKYQRWDEAESFAARLVEAAPENATYREVLRQIEARIVPREGPP